MSARIRGDHDTPWSRWRPTAPANQNATAKPRPATAPERESAPAVTGGRRERARAKRYRQVLGWLVASGVAIVAAYLALTWCLAQFSSAPARPKLPATPRAWLDAYEAAAIDDPGRVCSVLFAPALAQAYATTPQRSCNGYFRQITSLSVRVRRVFEDGGTAVLELRQTARPRDWAVVLDRRRGGWQAVDLLAGDLAR